MGNLICKDCAKLEDELERVLTKQLEKMAENIRRDLMEHITKEISVLKQDSAKRDDSDSDTLIQSLPMAIPKLTRQ